MKDYGISFIPDINQGSKEPSEPIVSDLKKLMSL